MIGRDDERAATIGRDGTTELRRAVLMLRLSRTYFHEITFLSVSLGSRIVVVFWKRTAWRKTSNEPPGKSNIGEKNDRVARLSAKKMTR